MSVVVIDCKGSLDLLEGMRRTAQTARLPFKFFSIEDRPGRALWNPLAHGDWSVNKDRLMDVEEWSEPFYKGQVETALQTVLRVMSMSGIPATLRTVRTLLDPGEFRRVIAAETSSYTGDDHAELLTWMEQVAKDPKRLSAVRDMQSRIDKLLGSVVGTQLVPTGPGQLIDLVADLDAGSMIVFSLSAPSYPIEAERIATWVARELQVLMAHRLRLDAAARRPTLVLVDEFPAVPLAARQLAAGYQMAREAGLSYVLSCQSAANLDSLDDPAAAMQITGNARLVIAARDREGAELTATRLGTVESWEPTMQTAQVGNYLAVGGEASTGQGSKRRVDTFVIHPNVLRRLPDHHVVVAISGKVDATGMPVLPQVCRVAPHHDHPLIDPPAPLTEAAVQRPRWSTDRLVGGGRRWLPTVAAAGGLLALAAIPVLMFRHPSGPVAAAPAATAAVSAVDGPVAWATAVIQAWARPAGTARDKQLHTLIGTTLDPAPITAAGAPVIIAVGNLDATRTVITFLLAGDDGTVTAWAVTIAGPAPWRLASLPVPVPAVASSTSAQATSLDPDPTATAELTPILADFFTAWGRGGDGDLARLQAVTAPGSRLRPIGGLELATAPTFAVGHPQGDTRLVDATVTWSRLGTARYLVILHVDDAGTWRVADVSPWPRTAIAPTTPTTPGATS